jgi:lactoylglutathione lyase
MRLAKPRLDVGLFTTNESAMLQFWQDTIGLPFEETLPLGGGVRQQRHAMNGSVLKINAARDALNPAPPTGYRRLIIARPDLPEPRDEQDPDGNTVTLVPVGHDGITGIAVELRVRDVTAHARFFAHAMQFEQIGPDSFRCGDSLLLLRQDPAAIRVEPLRAPGYRYLTVQVWDVASEHAGILDRGGEEGRPPVTLGSTARVSFVRDPDGNWIEVSQRASLTGPLPDTQ